MSLDGGDIGDSLSESTGWSKQRLMFAGGILVLLIAFFLFRNRKGQAQPTGTLAGSTDTTVNPDGSVSSGSVLYVPTTSIGSVIVNPVNGPWANPNPIDSNPNPTSPDGGADTPTNGGGATPGATIYGPGSIFPAPGGETTAQIAAHFRISGADLYYAFGNHPGPLQDWVQAHKPSGATDGISTVIIPAGLSVHIPHNAQPYVIGQQIGKYPLDRLGYKE